MPSQSPRPSAKNIARFAGAGIELAAFATLFALLGYGLDRWLGNTTYIATALAALVGFSLGFVRFMLLALKVNARQRQLDEIQKRNSS